MNLGELISTLQELEKLAGKDTSVNCDNVSLRGCYRYKLTAYRGDERERDWAVWLDCHRDEAGQSNEALVQDLRSVIADARRGGPQLDESPPSPAASGWCAKLQRPCMCASGGPYGCVK